MDIRIKIYRISQSNNRQDDRADDLICSAAFHGKYAESIDQPMDNNARDKAFAFHKEYDEQIPYRHGIQDLQNRR